MKPTFHYMMSQYAKQSYLGDVRAYSKSKIISYTVTKKSSSNRNDSEIFSRKIPPRWPYTTSLHNQEGVLDHHCAVTCPAHYLEKCEVLSPKMSNCEPTYG
ncbi:hypothetical protein AVEN_210615-1 [Araneus ventricosus]|uniref:Uncharacterized protein n=1 Tax=Araneus ventricosus TaxID=182803 RepID=A0A4Y2HYF3_ARAVE|nr:hypothetical protein AVEN_210615-1 [Araneus ventricosus]